MFISIEGFRITPMDRIDYITCSSGAPGTGDVIYQPKSMEYLGEECFGNLRYCIVIQFSCNMWPCTWVIEFTTKEERDKVFAEMTDDLAAGKQVLRIPSTACVKLQ